MAKSSNVVALRANSDKPPSIVNGKVQPPKRRKNKDVRSREYLTSDEVERLMKAARSVGRHGHRDSTMILLAFTHALRVSELVALKWDAFDLKQGLAKVAGLDMPVHPHMLRHATGFKLANDGHDTRAI